MVESESLCVAWACAEQVALLPQLPNCCDYRCVPSCRAGLDFLKSVLVVLRVNFKGVQEKKQDQLETGPVAVQGC